MKSIDKIITDDALHNFNQRATTLKIVSNCLKNEVENYGKDVFLPDYKLLLQRLSRPSMWLKINYKSLLKPHNNKKYMNEATTNIIKLVACLNILFHGEKITDYFTNNKVNIQEIIELNFPILNGLIATEERVNVLNNLQKSSKRAQVLSTPEMFNQYCCEIEILKIFQPMLEMKFFFDLQDFKDALIMQLAPKYGYYPNLFNENHPKQFSYSDLNINKLIMLLQKEAEICRLATLINKDLKDNASNFLVFDFKLNYGFLSYNEQVNNPDMATIIINLTKKLLTFDKFSRNAIMFLNHYIDNIKSPITTKLIKKQINKFNTKDNLSMMEHHEIGKNIINLLMSNENTIPLPQFTLHVNPMFYFDNYSKRAAVRMLETVWSKMNITEKTAAMRNFLYNIGYETTNELSKTQKSKLVEKLNNTEGELNTDELKIQLSIKSFFIVTQFTRSFMIKIITAEPDLFFKIETSLNKNDTPLMRMLNNLSSKHLLPHQSKEPESLDGNQLIH